MSYTIFTDTSANIPTELLKERGIEVIAFRYYVDGEEHTCLDTGKFDGDTYYAAIKSGVQVTTAQIPPQHYIDCFAPALEAGNDVIFVSMSSGISGSCGSARIAAEELKEMYPTRSVEIVDTLGASLGEGIIALHAADMRDAGVDRKHAVDKLNSLVKRMCQVFTVDDLMHLRRGGRLSNLSAVVGTVLHIKPLLIGNEEGKIISIAKLRGRRRAIETLAEWYDKLAVEPENQIVGIAQAGCRKDAELLVSLLNKNRPPKQILNVEYEPVTGSHVGPGALALFFIAGDDVRLMR